MSIKYVIASPGSGMTYHGLPLSGPVGSPAVMTVPAPLPCICCGEDVFKNHLCKDCFDSMLEEGQS